MESKELIMCHLDGHWVPFKDEVSLRAYLLRLVEDFGFDISKVRVFRAVFTEFTLDINSNIESNG